MSKSFSDFCKEEKKAQSSQEESLQSAYDEIKNMDYDELTERLYKEVRSQKENGTFNFESLQASIESIKPFISSETYANMKNMLDKLK